MEFTTKIRLTREDKKRVESLKNENESDAEFMNRLISWAEHCYSLYEGEEK